MTLSGVARVSEPVIKQFEAERGAPIPDEAVAKMIAALKSAGIIFIEENGEGQGVRLRKGNRLGR
jgi:hypothetical protein